MCNFIQTYLRNRLKLEQRQPVAASAGVCCAQTQAIITSTKIAFVVVLAMFAALAVMAGIHIAHSRHTH
jgi:hypothetical protein